MAGTDGAGLPEGVEVIVVKVSGKLGGNADVVTDKATGVYASIGVVGGPAISSGGPAITVAVTLANAPEPHASVMCTIVLAVLSWGHDSVDLCTRMVASSMSAGS